MSRVDDDGRSSVADDDDWLRRFLDEALPVAMGVAHRICRSRSDAEDAVMSGVERFIRAFRNGRVDHRKHPRAYLLTAVRNEAINTHRRHPTPPVFAHLEPLSPEEHADRIAEAGAMAAALVKLNARHRECLGLVDEMDGDMVAAGQRMRPALDGPAMRSLAFRARQALRNRFVECMVGGWPTTDCQALITDLIERRSISAPEEAHMATCVACTAAEEELAGHGVRRFAVVPVPLALVDTVSGLLANRGAEPLSGVEGGGVTSGGGSVLAVGCGLGAAVLAAALAGVLVPWSGSGGTTPGAERAARGSGGAVVDAQGSPPGGEPGPLT